MKQFRKKTGILLALVLMLSMVFTGCGESTADVSSPIKEGQSDLDYVKSKGKILVGITDYAPMDYRDGEDWKGFDAEMARAFADSIGVDVEFCEIDWDKKTELLEKGDIDCIWNGMTMTEELQQTISCSDPYLSNAQVVVLRSDEMGKYSTEDACQHLLFAVEAGSTGETILKEKHYRYTACDNQMKALESVRDKKSDATVIDIIMAGYYTGEGQQFADLGFEISLNNEKICVGCRKGSDLTKKVNEFLKTSYEDGTIQSLADQYKIGNAVMK